MVNSDRSKTWADIDRWEAFQHRLKVWGHQSARAAMDWKTIHRWPQQRCGTHTQALATVASRLWYPVPPEEWMLEAGKVANVRVAAQLLNGLEIPAHETFSFWRHVGRPTASRGFVVGREIRAGCVIPTIAGGLCLLSNALYRAALQANFEIVERHGHTMQLLTGQDAEPDATVFWNYVDLRFRSSRAWRVHIEMDERELRVQFLSDVAPAERPVSAAASTGLAPSLAHKSCWSCEELDCRHYQVSERKEARRALLLDSRWPEFDAWVTQNLRPNDWVLLPVDGTKHGLKRYAWTLDGVAVVECPLAFGARALSTRLFSTQGPDMRRMQLRMDEILAVSMGRMLPVEVTELVVSQHLLPHLERHGFLGGRSYDVLVTRPPLAGIQAALDSARARWPERSSLGDFRVEKDQVNAERKALEGARHLYTPNASVASEYASKTTIIPWVVADRVSRCSPRVGGQPVIHFPGSTIARLGVCALREAIQGLDVTLQIAGRNLEEPTFWDGVRWRTGQALDDVDLVVFPAWLPHNPRVLLRAIARGIPVIVSDRLGLGVVAGVTEIPCGDVDALRAAIRARLEQLSPPVARQTSRL